MPLTLRGTEVVLRPLSLHDVPALALATAESRDTYLYNPVPNGIAEAQAYVEKALAQQAQVDRMPFTIVWNGRVVGRVQRGRFPVFPVLASTANVRSRQNRKYRKPSPLPYALWPNRRASVANVRAVSRMQ